MHLFPALLILALVMLVFMAPIAANWLRLRHHDHLISGHPRAPR
jgi:hypothetical protein